METALTILMVLGVYLGIPAVIGLAIAGVTILTKNLATKTEQIKTFGEAQA